MQRSDPAPANRTAVSTEGAALRKAVGVVGPNAILQLIEPLREAGGEGLLNDVFTRARVFQYLANPPLAMVPEEQAQRLFGATRAFLGCERGDEVLRQAGEGTARYVMQHRIPGPVRGLLRLLPAPLSARMLLTAIERNAWTFAGSGSCRTGVLDNGWFVAIENNPLATPGCPWHAGVLETMFRTLVSKRAALTHADCGAHHCPGCRFELRLS